MMFDEVEKLINQKPKAEKKKVKNILVWQFMNEIEGENKTADEWHTWAYMNKLTPCDIMEEMDERKLNRLLKRYSKNCDIDCLKCLDKFFNEVV